MNKRLFRLRMPTNVLPAMKEAAYKYFAKTFGCLAKRCLEFARRIAATDSEHCRSTIPVVVDSCTEREFLPCRCERSGIKSFWLAPGAFGRRCDPNVKFGTVACKSSACATHVAEKHEKVPMTDDNFSAAVADGACIRNVTDTATGLRNNTASAGKYLIIEGEKILVFPEDDADLGVFFVDATGRRFRSDDRLRHNDGMKVLVRVPKNLAPGVYRLEIVTRFSSNGTWAGMPPRTIRYEFPLHVS